MEAEQENARKILESEDRLEEIKDISIYQCEFCGRIDMIKSKHQEHVAGHDADQLDQVFKCKKCNIDFYSKEALREHVAAHPDQRRYICDVCGNSFKNRYALTLHNRSHTGEKPFKSVFLGIPGVFLDFSEVFPIIHAI
jgi:uncharacterized Zn-finger protein